MFVPHEPVLELEILDAMLWKGLDKSTFAALDALIGCVEAFLDGGRLKAILVSNAEVRSAQRGIVLDPRDYLTRRS